MDGRRHHRIVVTERGGPEVLQWVPEPIPVPAADAARVKVEVAGVSAFDLMVRASRFPGFPRVPFTPGVDVVGVVDKVGERVAGVRPGDRVVASTGLAGGGYAECICLPAGNLVPLPDGVDGAEAVCLVANYLTAHIALHRVTRVESGERILVQGAAGGVGTALLELGGLAGLEMYGTASRHNHAVVAAFGAIPIDYHVENVVERIRALTGDGVDAVFDPVGGGGQLWRSYRALNRHGRLVWIGVAATSRFGIRVIPISLLTQLVLKLIPDGRRVPLMPNAGKVAESEHAWYFETLTDLLDLLAAGKIRPVIAERVPLREAARAHRLLERGGQAGKVVLTAP